MSKQAAVITISDKGFLGQREDTSGPAVCKLLAAAGYAVVHTAILPDERGQIEQELRLCADEKRIPLVLTTGGTGFSPRDVTPEATLAVVERETRGIPEAMRAASLRLTPRGCLSRAVAGIRGQTLIVNLPGSEKAARENLEAVQEALGHGLDMLQSAGSANCAEPAQAPAMSEKKPSLEQWLREAKAEAGARQCGMYLFHNGVVRATARKQVREGCSDAPEVVGMDFSWDAAAVAAATDAARRMPGVYHVRVWLNQGRLKAGDDMMLVLVGGDIRPHVTAALDALVGELKAHCVTERELSAL